MRPSRIWIYLLGALSMMLLAACIGITSTFDEPPPAPAAADATQPEATLVPEEDAAAIATATDAPILDTPTPEPVVEPADWTTTASMDGDYYILGNPNAPIRLIDFSDFL